MKRLITNWHIRETLLSLLTMLSSKSLFKNLRFINKDRTSKLYQHPKLKDYSELRAKILMNMAIINLNLLKGKREIMRY